MSRMRQVGPFGRSESRKSGTDANSRASTPTDRKSRPTDSRNAGSSAITETRGSDSGIASPARKDRKAALVPIRKCDDIRVKHIPLQKQTLRLPKPHKPKFSGAGLATAA